MLDRREFRKHFKVGERIKTGGNRTQFRIDEIEEKRIRIRPLASKGRSQYLLPFRNIDAVIAAFPKIDPRNIEETFHRFVRGPVRGDTAYETYLYGIAREFINRARKQQSNPIFPNRAKKQQSDPTFPDQIAPAFSKILIEGAKEEVVVNRYERSPEAKALCIRHWRDSCIVCGFNFERFYGDFGKGFIHVHHLVSLAKIGRRYKLDPVQHLRPVCPNCHAMIHHSGRQLSIEELRRKLRPSN